MSTCGALCFSMLIPRSRVVGVAIIDPGDPSSEDSKEDACSIIGGSTADRRSAEEDDRSMTGGSFVCSGAAVCCCRLLARPVTISSVAPVGSATSSAAMMSSRWLGSASGPPKDATAWSFVATSITAIEAQSRMLWEEQAHSRATSSAAPRHLGGATPPAHRCPATPTAASAAAERTRAPSQHAEVAESPRCDTQHE